MRKQQTFKGRQFISLWLLPLPTASLLLQWAVGSGALLPIDTAFPFAGSQLWLFTSYACSISCSLEIYRIVVLQYINDTIIDHCSGVGTVRKTTFFCSQFFFFYFLFEPILIVENTGATFSAMPVLSLCLYSVWSPLSCVKDQAGLNEWRRKRQDKTTKQKPTPPAVPGGNEAVRIEEGKVYNIQSWMSSPL